MADEWFLIRNGRREGPLSAAELRRRAAAGDITASNFVWRQGLKQPVSCARVQGLLPESAAVSPAPASQPMGATAPVNPVTASATGTPGRPACPHCGRSVTAGDAFCTGCGKGIAGPTPGVSTEDMAIGMLVPHKVTVLSVVAGYMGLLSFCVIPAPLALLLGILALSELRKNPGKLGYSRAIFAIVMGGLGSVVAVVAAVAFGISAMRL